MVTDSSAQGHCTAHQASGTPGPQRVLQGLCWFQSSWGVTLAWPGVATLLPFLLAPGLQGCLQSPFFPLRGLDTVHPPNGAEPGPQMQQPGHRTHLAARYSGLPVRHPAPAGPVPFPSVLPPKHQKPSARSGALWVPHNVDNRVTTRGPSLAGHCRTPGPQPSLRMHRGPAHGWTLLQGHGVTGQCGAREPPASGGLGGHRD